VIGVGMGLGVASENRERRAQLVNSDINMRMSMRKRVICLFHIEGDFLFGKTALAHLEGCP
jgi:hypothetical protein